MRLPRPVAVVLAAAAGLLTASCVTSSSHLLGDAATATSTTTTVSRSDTTTPLSASEQAVADRVQATYEKLGLAHDKAACLADAVTRLMIAGKMPTNVGDPTQQGPIMDAINTCDISVTEIAKMGLLGDGSPEGSFKVGFAASLEQLGLTQKEASCVADAYVKAYGTDASAATDQTKVLPLLQGCGVDPTKVGG